MNGQLLDGLRIVLVFTPYKDAEHEVVLKETREHLGVIPPISLAYVAAVFEQSGAEVRIIDLGATPMSGDVFAESLRGFKPDWVGFTLNTFHFHHTLKWIRRARKAIDTRIIVGGAHLAIYPQEVMCHKEIDCAVIGDAHGTAEPLVAALSSGRFPTELANVVFRRDGEVVITERIPSKVKLGDHPLPARHLLPVDRYNSLISKRKNFTAMMSSRGCPCRCAYCENTYIAPDFRSAEAVVEEMELCYENFSIREIDFFDASFTANKRRVYEICSAIKEKGLDISWSVRTRVDMVDEDLLGAMADAGCTRLYYGIESAVPEILKNLNRTTDLTMAKTAIKATRKAGMASFGYFMFGSPGETEETIEQTARFSRQVGLDYAMYSPVFTPPATQLYASLMPQLGEDYWARFTLDESAQRVLPRYGTDLSDERIQQLVRKAFLAFYLRPGYVLKSVLRLRSFDEARRAVAATLDMVSGYLRTLFVRLQSR